MSDPGVREVRPGATITLQALGFPAAQVPPFRLVALVGGAVVIGPTTVGITEDSPGNYDIQLDIPADLAPGDYVGEWREAVGPPERWSRDDDIVRVTLSPAGLPYGFAIEELLAYVQAARGADQAHLERLLSGAHGYAKWVTKRRLEPLPSGSGTYTVRRRVDGRRFARVPDAREVVEVLVDGVAQTDWEGVRGPDEEASPMHTIEVFVRGRAIEVTGRFGFDPVPIELKDAIYTHAARNYHERTALYADMISSPEYGTQTYLRQLPARVRDVYEAFRVPSDQWSL